MKLQYGLENEVVMLKTLAVVLNVILLFLWMITLFVDAGKEEFQKNCGYVFALALIHIVTLFALLS